jgi:hypothetical protein
MTGFPGQRAGDDQSAVPGICRKPSPGARHHQLVATGGRCRFDSTNSPAAPVAGAGTCACC